MGFNPFFGENDRLLWRFIAGKPRRELGSWRNESTGESFDFRDDSPASDRAWSAAIASYSRTLGQVTKSVGAGLTMGDVIGKKFSSED